MRIAIIDYGMGNLRSVHQAFEFLGFEAFISNDYKKIQEADKIVLPGVGAFKTAIDTISQKGIDEVLFNAIRLSKPILGICLGMQLMFDKSYENGVHNGLALLPGEIKRLPDDLKIPHIGWNNINIKKATPLFDGLNDDPFVYFVHSYYLETSDDIVTATTLYGMDINVSVQKKNIYAVQFHPEKSSENGLMILKNFGGLK